jgi:hypothetical protein
MTGPAGDSAPGGDSGESGAPPPPAAPNYRGMAITLAAALLLLVALAGTAPWWAPSLPWAAPSARSRIDQIDRALTQMRDDEATAAAAHQELDRRVAALAAKPAPAAGDMADLRQQMAKLSTGNADLASQVAALGEAVGSRQEAAAASAERIASIENAVQAQAKAGAELTARVEGLEKTAQRAASSGSSDTAIALALLQLRDALASGRPFAAEYGTLTAASRDRPAITTAAAPLAALAKTGVARHAVLAARLHRLAPAILKLPVPEAAGAAEGWSAQLLARLRGLVRVRRIDGAGAPTEIGAAATIDDAEQALADGDLAASVAVVEKLRDGAADAARPWLDMAKKRLAAERAFQQIEAALSADLGTAARAPPAAGAAR